MPPIRNKSQISKPLKRWPTQTPSNRAKLRTLAIRTKYWRPGTDFVAEITKAIDKRVLDDDFVVISEKAISTAKNNIVDENRVHANRSAKFIARFWMKEIWGRILGPICGLRQKLLRDLRAYPVESGSRHKHVALQYGSLLEALMFGSEAGIDGSNLPYSFVSLPLTSAEEIANNIRLKIATTSGKKVHVMIVDTDKTYSFRNFHFTPRPMPFNGIHSGGGFITYVAGRFIKLKKRSTPLAVSGCILSTEEALRIAELTNRSRGYGSGRTVWDMAEHFKVSLEEVSWGMLETVRHKPIVIVRKKR